MKNNQYRIAQILIPALLVMLVSIVSCKKDEEDLDPMRRFMPGGDIKSTSTETSVLLYWNPSLYTESTDTTVRYRVQVSKDSTFAIVEYRYVTDTTGIMLTDNDLTVRQKYYARVQTIGADSTLDSKWLRSSSFTITGEQIFLPVQDADIVDKAVILNWKPTTGVTKIVLTPSAGTPVEVTLLPADVTAAKRLVEGLQAGTTYTAEIFAGTKSKGIVTFNTKAPVVGNIIDLRGITGRPSVLQDTLPQIPSGSIVILKRGQTYEITTVVNLSKSVTIMSGDDFIPDLAKINLTTNFNIAAGSLIDSIVFNRVKLVGPSYSASYVLNVSNACTIGKMIFESCQAEIFRGMVRLQTAVINVTTFNVNNCIIDSISNYGVVNVDNVNCKIDNINITNSTIYKTEKVVTSRQNSLSVLIQNCTINEAPWGGGANYLVDYSQSATNNVTNGVTISNCIMGVGKNNGGNTTVRGVRINATSQLNSAGNYNTSDYAASANLIPSLIAYSGTSFALWQDPANGNFAFKDNNFAGKGTAGDPRWRQ